MNLKDYIESGLLESYLMGELSDEEMKEVDRLAARHPVIGQELEKIRKGILTYAEATGNRPHPDVLRAALKTLQDDQEDTQTGLSKLQDTAENRIKSFPVWYVAASVLLLVSITFNLILFRKLRENREEIRSLTTQRTLLAEQVETASLKLDDAETRIAHFTNEDNIRVRMEGSEISPRSFAHVFWNKKTNTVFISVDNLPEPPHGHQYQLWAIKPGQSPIDAGIFDYNEQIQKLKVIKGDVMAFAVTLEKEGGTPHATVEKTYVKGFL